MASYHRVLRVFDRSVHAKSLECDQNIDPWELLVDDERWHGKVRLIGYVDAFFLICYSGTERFERGIIIYKEENSIRRTLERAGKTDESEHHIIDEEAKGDNLAKSYYSFKDKAVLHYDIVGWGHPIDLKTNYAPSDLKKYNIKISKSDRFATRKRIERGLRQHTLTDLMLDVVRLGFISHGELIAWGTNLVLAGTATDDAARKYLLALGGGQGQALARDSK